MRIIPDDRDKIASFLNKNPYLNLYSIGDLDEELKPYIDWYGFRHNNTDLTAVACVYNGGDTPTLLGLSENPSGDMTELLKGLVPELDTELQAHLSPGLEKLFKKRYKTI